MPPGAGADHDPLNFGRGADTFHFLRASEGVSTSWVEGAVSDPATEAEELKWCHYGGNPTVGKQDRGRVDRLQVVEVTVKKESIEDPIKNQNILHGIEY